MCSDVDGNALTGVIKVSQLVRIVRVTLPLDHTGRVVSVESSSHLIIIKSVNGWYRTLEAMLTFICFSSCTLSTITSDPDVLVLAHNLHLNASLIQQKPIILVLNAELILLRVEPLF